MCGDDVALAALFAGRTEEKVFIIDRVGTISLISHKKYI